MDNKYSMFECCEVKNCPKNTRDIDGKFYCENPICHHVGDCSWCEHYLTDMSWCEKCRHNKTCSQIVRLAEGNITSVNK